MICYNISIGNGVYPCSNCVCTEGYNGTTCDCPTSTDACTDNNGTICSDRGQCVCGKCVCDDNYQGEQCQECSTCPGQCKANQDCAECVGFKQGKLSESDCLAQCSHVTTEAVLPVENVTKCQFFDDEGCQIEFTYEYDEEFQLKVVVKDTKTAHGCDIFQKEIYAETGSAVILSCQISTEALTQSWRKDFLVLTRGFEMNRNLGGHERLTLIIDKWFYNLKIYNLTENDFGTYVCETQQGNSITEEVTKLIHSVTSTVILNEDTTTGKLYT
ncbi:integrin beta-PS-like [Mytilus galloprovincialis]|uniref:integrin beta-PS-like n=1 Tax=Mytilus galloprovincialis TaxID=29158 RepID=UPI003F7C9F0F